MTPEQKIEIEKFFKSLGLIAGTAGVIYQDKKIDMLDMGAFMALFANSAELIDGFDDMDVVFAGMKSMSVDEIINALKSGVDVGKTYESNRKA